MGEKGVCPAKGSRVGHRSCKGRPRQFTDKVPPFVLEKSSEGSIKGLTNPVLGCQQGPRMLQIWFSGFTCWRSGK